MSSAGMVHSNDDPPARRYDALSYQGAIRPVGITTPPVIPPAVAVTRADTKPKRAYSHTHARIRVISIVLRGSRNGHQHRDGRRCGEKKFPHGGLLSHNH